MDALMADIPSVSVQVRKLQLTEEGGRNSHDSRIVQAGERKGGGKYLQDTEKRDKQDGLIRKLYIGVFISKWNMRLDMQL